MIEWKVKYKTKLGWKWGHWRHVVGFRSEEERNDKLKIIKIHPTRQKIRLVNYKPLHSCSDNRLNYFLR